MVTIFLDLKVNGKFAAILPDCVSGKITVNLPLTFISKKRHERGKN